MSVTVPNIEDSPSYDAMAVRDSADLFALSCTAQGTGVISGMSVTQDTGSDMKVAVAGGVVSVAGVLYSYTGSGSPFTINAASTSDRRDSFVYTVGSGVVYVPGTPCGYTTGNWTASVTTNNPPVKAAVPANSVLLAEVYVAGSGGSATTVITTATNIVDKRNISTQIVPYPSPGPEAGTTAGGALAQQGLLANATRHAAVHVVIGDSIGSGWGATQGSTDWFTDLLNLENQGNGLAPAGRGLVLCNDGADGSAWSNIANGTTPGSALYYGPSIANTSLQLATTGKSISDTRGFRRVFGFYQTAYNGDGLTFAVTGGSAPTSTVDTHSAATGATCSAFVITVPTANLVGAAPMVGDAVTYQSGGAWTWASAPTIKTITTSGSNTLITLSVTLGGGTGGTSSTVSFSGYRQWDSGDLGSIVGTAISATWATHVTGAGGSGAYVIGARYYNTDGTNGIIGDVIAIGGTTACAWGGSTVNAFQPGYAAWGWLEWLQMNANYGTPVARMYDVSGINDPAAGFTGAQVNTCKTAIIAQAAIASPSTEVVEVAEYYGDVIATYANTVATSGSPVVYSTTNGVMYYVAGSGFPAEPILGSTFGGAGIPAATTVTTAPSAPSVITANSGSITGSTYTGTGMTTGGIYAITGGTITGLIIATASSPTSAALTVPTGGGAIGAGGGGTFNLYPAATLSANATAGATITGQQSLQRQGPTGWVANFVAAIAQSALAGGAKFINLYDRFGDVSARGFAANVTTKANDCVISCAAGFPNAAAGMAVNGPHFYPGTQVQAYSAGATTLTLTQPAFGASTTDSIYYGQDTWGQLQSSNPNIHLGDYSQSWSGSDGQNAMAAFIFGRLNSIYKSEIPVGSDTSLIAGGYFTPTFVSDTALQLSTTSDVMLYVQITTAAALRIRMGPTTAGNSVNVAGTQETIALGVVTCRVPRGWYVLIHGTIADIVTTAVPC